MTTYWTSSNRPPTPYVGQAIVEADTGNWLIYYGPNKGWTAPWNLPWGEISYTEVTTTSTYAYAGAPGPNSSRNNPANISISTFMREGRKYLFEIDAYIYNPNSSGPQGSAQLQIGDRSLETNNIQFDPLKFADAKQWNCANTQAANTAMPVSVEALVEVDTDVSKTFDFRGSRDGFGGSFALQNQTHFQLHDVGPAGDVNTDLVFEGWDISKWDTPSGIWR